MSKGKVIGICVACVAVGALLVAVYLGPYTGFKNAKLAVSQRIDAMFSSIENGSFGETYENETTNEMRRAVSKDQYLAIGASIGEGLGKLTSKSLKGWRIRRFNSESIVDVTYAASFEKGNAVVIATLKRRDGPWKFVSFYVDSPVFARDLEAVKCLSCGKLHDRNARFCPHCGTEATTDATQDR